MLDKIREDALTGEMAYLDIDIQRIKDSLDVALDAASEACIQIENAVDELQNEEFVELIKECGLFKDVDKVIKMLDKQAWGAASSACDAIEEVL